MNIIYKLIALCVVFGLVSTNPAAKMTEESFDDLAYDSWYNVADVVVDNVAEESHAAEVVVPKPGLIPTVLSLIPKIVGLKVKIISIVASVIKWLAPKTFFLAIGAVATFTFCKLSGLCSVAYEPAVYDYVPSQVRDFVTPEQLEDAQQFLVRALQQYAKH